MSVSVKPQDCSVALLAGGASSEREVSLASGQGVKKALEDAGFSVTVLDPASKEDIKTLIDGNFDVAFICLHGRLGEDGSIQGFLEIIGIPYVGSKVWSSALAMDKGKAKFFYELEGIKTPQYVTLTSLDEKSPSELLETVGSPCVIKPASEGSTVGVFIVDNEKAVKEALKIAFEMDREVLAEQYIVGRELTVAVLGNDAPYALPVVEIIPKEGFYDYEAKYTPGGSQHFCPAPLSETDTKKVMALAVEAHKALGCRGLSRSDFILDDQGNFWILETNTIPGMTPTSLLPDAGRAAHIDFPVLCTRLIEFALEEK